MGLLGKLLNVFTTLNATLPQSKTNGASQLGLVSAPVLPNFMTNNPLPNGYPWGSDTVTKTNPYRNSPNTGVTRYYTFNVSRGTLSPDGYQKQMILVNGAFPGPTIEANWGDTIQVTVQNNIQSPAEGTAIHWHGFLQHNSQWMDGVPALSQCPIAPGKTFTYSFKAELYGTTWYHAHYSAQYSDGVQGAMVIYGPKNRDYDIDLGPVMLSDLYHVPYLQTVNYTVMGGPPRPPPNITSDNNLINGKMDFNCSTVAPGDKTPCVNNAGVSEFKFTTGKRHRLRVINSAADATQQFSIDGHILTVIANDFVPIVPYNTTILTLGIGQRSDIIVTANYTSNSTFWMRSNITCSTSLNPNALAVVMYDKASTSAIPTSTPQAYTPGCNNDPLASTVPAYPMNPGSPATTQTINITVAQNSTGSWLWYMNKSSFRGDYNDPTLLLAKAGNTSYPYSPQFNIYNTGTNNSYRFIVNNLTPAPHPLHFHGHNMFVLAVGAGTWDGTTIVNPTNPQRRDVQLVPPFGYMVWQANADNPGVWPFHCHIAWHAGAGLFVDVMENPAAIQNLRIPSSVNQVCADWNAFSATGKVDQIEKALESSKKQDYETDGICVMPTSGIRGLM